MPPFLVVLALVLLAAPKGESLKISSIEVPPAVINGAQVTLICHYHLPQSEQLYSVKWYKNYVEFYRYQPKEEEEEEEEVAASGGGREPRPGRNDTAPGEQVDEAGPGAGEENERGQANADRYEFELAGIDLDLAQSNGTHVHLRQVSLTSQGSYKCEVSADSPSFVTVSMERELKVYALPKQKLQVSLENDGPDRKEVRQVAANELLAFSINDTLNLTCTSGPSWPPAELSWLINGIQVGGLPPPPGGAAHQHQISLPSKFNYLPNSPATPVAQLFNETQLIPFEGAHLAVSKLTLVFLFQPNHLLNFSDTQDHSYLSTNLRTGDEEGTRQQTGKLTCLARFNFQFSSQTSISVHPSAAGAANERSLIRSESRPIKKSKSSSPLLPEPSSLIKARSRASLSGGFSESESINADTLARYYRWPPPPSLSSHFVSYLNKIHKHQDEGLPDDESHLMPGSWATWQLDAQADFIGHHMRLSRPNELEAPLVEPRAPPGGGGLATRFDDNITNEEHSQARSLSSLNDTPPGGDEQALADRPSTWSPVNLADYQLDDLLEFTCRPRLVPAESTGMKSVHAEWSINNKVINGPIVNAYDGSRFYYSASGGNKTSNSLPPAAVQRLRPSNFVPGEATYTNEPTASHPGHTDTTSLWLKFTSSLLQAKEINLKCRTVVEQPLIEFEHQLLISVARNKFIQVERRQHRPSGRLSSGQQHRGGWQRSSLPRGHQVAVSDSAVCSTIQVRPAVAWLTQLTTILVLVSLNQRRRH